MQKTGKLELTWVGKYDDKVVEPRILVEDVDKSYGDPTSENMLIHGDNLIALQAICFIFIRYQVNGKKDARFPKSCNNRRF